MSTQPFGEIAAAFLALALFGCSSGGNLESTSTSASASSTSLAAADPARARERPGLATTFGETHGSRVTKGEFERRAPDRPWLLAAIFYNDEAGADAAAAG